MFNEQINVSGKVQLLLYDAAGNLKVDCTYKNLIVTVGKAFITSRMIDNSTNVMSHIEVGTSSTAAIASQTGLVAPLTPAARAPITSVTRVTTLTANDSLVFSATFAAGVATGDLREAGIFNESTGGIMLCRSVFPVQTKTAYDTLTINWTVTLG